MRKKTFRTIALTLAAAGGLLLLAVLVSEGFLVGIIACMSVGGAVLMGYGRPGCGQSILLTHTTIAGTLQLFRRLARPDVFRLRCFVR